MKNNNGGGVGFFSVLQIVFIVLKLCGVINWSWLWVLSPTWISAAIVVILILFSILLKKICDIL